ncbi:MAG: SDR family oxidoreductase [Deltaproteobacteria bacterium]|nr:MAG: SDR family oxidoreductase [Deltaproteobacteria bacterium]
MGTIAVTGSASGIGAATAERLRADGHRVIGVDLRDAEVCADLSTPAGRQEAVGAVAGACGGSLDGLVTCAGIPGDIHPGERVISVNYFGSAALLDGLRPALARGSQPSAVAISSLSTTVVPDVPEDVIDACLEGDEASARSRVEKRGWAAYAASKIAIARFVRRRAVRGDWVGAGIRLNAVAPGRIRTALDAALLADERMRPVLEALPIPVGEAGRPEDVAGVVRFLLGSEARFFCGSILYMDGGSEAWMRPDAQPPTFHT